MIAASQGHRPAVELLLGYGPDLAAVDKFGKRVHEKARNPEIAALLLAAERGEIGQRQNEVPETMGLGTEGTHMTTLRLSPAARRKLREITEGQDRAALNGFVQKIRGQLQDRVNEQVEQGFRVGMKTAEEELVREMNRQFAEAQGQARKESANAFNGTIGEIMRKNRVKPDAKCLLALPDLGCDEDHPFSDLKPEDEPAGFVRELEATPSEDIMAILEPQLESICQEITSTVSQRLDQDMAKRLAQVRSTMREEMRHAFSEFTAKMETSIASQLREKVIRVSKQISEKNKRRAISPQPAEVPQEQVDEFTSLRQQLISARSSTRSSCHRMVESQRAPSQQNFTVLTAGVRSPSKPQMKTQAKRERRKISYDFVSPHTARVTPGVASPINPNHAIVGPRVERTPEPAEDNGEDRSKCLNQIDNNLSANCTSTNNKVSMTKLSADHSVTAVNRTNLENLGGPSADYKARIAALEQKCRSIAQHSGNFFDCADSSSSVFP